MLQRQGIVIARRTIAKYREELQILPSRLRRTRAGQTTRPTIESLAVTQVSGHIH